ncbi:hypothetical protein TanjilG_15596 [Lupinus angustifolius]|uniref:formin-like protein 11 n=1 Tax=Lupinus angustifolius TaxID=3871 RepID=UPI00090EB3BA|nr:PREDICTED: formin-like protein 11 [Lupinus angustifolius]OIV90863.1 hypothetical protein TanjilG_15596 [Lupinus angustifolius]
MGYGYEFLTMIFIMTLFMFLSLQRIHILNVDDMLIEMEEKEKNEQGNENQVKKISGLDENEMKEAMIVEKFRALLGLKSFHTKLPSQFLSPSISPSPSPNIEPYSPAPTPSPIVPQIHSHSHHPRHHHSHWNPPLHNNKTHAKEDRGKDKRIILVAVLVSVGVATLVCACGLILVCRNFRNNRKKPNRKIPLCTKNKGTDGVTSTYQNSSSKVSSNSEGLDLSYVNALGDDIEQQGCTSKRICKNNIEIYDNVSSSSTKEILFVHEDEGKSVVKGEYESDGNDNENSCSKDKIIPLEEEYHSSDDESFHSLVDSQHSNIRLSNASAGSFCETMSMSPQNSTLLVSLPNQFPTSPNGSFSKTRSHQSPYSPIHEEQEIFETSPKILIPPPPPLPLKMPLFTLHSLTTSSSRVSSNSPHSVTSHILSSPRNSDTYSVSNPSPEKQFLSPPQLNSTKSSPNIPPPPCPPPFFKGNKINNNSKTPPPPPSQFPHFTPLCKDGATLPKLKPLHWDKVRAAPNRTMVWDKLRSSSFELDEEMIESLFGYNLQSSMKNDETKSKSPSPSKHVLEPKRLQNITILKKALNLTSEQVCQALTQGKGLSLPQLEALVKMVPTKEEEGKLLSYNGDINELGSAEKFVRAMLIVPFAFQRIEGMLYRETFEDEVVHLRNSFSMLEEACKELRSSRLFLKLLEAVLKTGNRMNVGTIRGGARAFKLDALLKLADVKGTDGRTTLLHFVVQEIVRAEGIKVSVSIMGKISQKNSKLNKTEEEKEEDYKRMGLELVSGLSTELYNVKKTATIDLDVLASSVSNLRDGMGKLQYLVEEELFNDEESENFVSSIKCFLSYADRNLRELQGDEDRVIARVKEITEYFHGDVSKEDNPLRIFVIVRDFLGMLDNVCKELRRSKAHRTPNPLAPFR